ncbi:MAG: translocation/assembly module TamB domain-containing protein [Deltaproteobacteria bacterium]|nr:translocation/assembly module TamB domain-containing protein [Deltaproteobacteria bacterium]
MKRGTLIRTVFLLGLLATGLVLLLRSAWTGKKLCGEIERRVPALAPGVKIHIDQCQVEPLDLGVALSGVRVDLPDQPSPAIAAAGAEVRLSLLQALWGTVRLDRVALDHPVVNLDLSHLPEAPPPQKKKSNRCDAVNALQQVDVARLAVTDGAVHLNLPGQRALDLAELNVTAHTRRGVSAVRVSEAGGKLAFPGGTLPLEKLSISAQLDAPAADLEVQRLQAQAGQLSLLAHGSVHDLCDPELNVEANAGVPLDLVVALAQPEGVKAKGYVTLNASLNGKLDAPNAHAEVDVTDLDVKIGPNDVNPKDLSASIDLHDDKIEITELLWPFPDGFARAEATITRKDNWPIVAKVDAEKVPFGELMNRLPLKHTWVDVNGEVHVARLTGHLQPTPALSGAAKVDLTDFHVRTRPWDSPAQKDDEVLQIARAHLDTDVGITPERVKLTHARLTTEKGGDASVEATLYTDPKRGLDLTGTVNRFDLSEFGPIVGLPWSGVGQANNVHITGAYGQQVIDGQVSVKDFSFTSVHPGDISGTIHFDPSMVLQGSNMVATKGKTTYRAKGLLDFSMKGGPYAAGNLSVDNGRIEDLLEVLHDVHWSFEMFHELTTGSVSGTIALQKGPVLAPTSDIRLQLRNVVTYDRPLGDADFRMLTDNGETLTVPEFTFRGGAGVFTVSGWQQVGGKLDFHVKADGVPLKVAASPELDDWEMTGTLSGEATIGGTQQQVAIKGEVFGQDLTMFGLPLGQGHVQIQGIGDSMQITGPVGDDVTLWSRMRWEDDFPVQAKLTFEVTDLYKYVPTRTEWNDVSGSMQGTLTLSGNMKGDTGYQGTYLFPKVLFTKGDYTEENTDPVRLDFDGDRFELKSFSFRGHGPGGAVATANDFSITGTRIGEERALDLRVKGSLDAKLFETLTPKIDASSGHVDVAAHVTGTQSDPEFSGSLMLSNGMLKLHEQPVALSEMQGRLQFNQNAVEVNELRGILNRGEVELTGTVPLSHFRPASYDLHLKLDETKWKLSSFPDITLSAHLQLTGKASDPFLSGELDVDRFVYAEDLTPQSVIANATKAKVDKASFTDRAKVVNFDDIQVKLDPDNVRVKNNLMDAHLRDNDLVLRGDDAHPILRGSIEAWQGTGANKPRAFYNGNEFSISDLRVSFSDTERITPYFDLSADTIVRDYRIHLHAFGTPDDFANDHDGNHVVPDSTPPLNKADIITLLTYGFTSQDRTAAGGSGATALGADIIGKITGVNDTVTRFIPRNNILKEPSVRLTSMYSQALGSMQPTVEVDGKLFIDQLHLRLQEPVNTGGRGMRMQGEYKIDDSKSIQAQIDRDNSDYNFPDFGVDVKLRWEMK